jgi:hypothetical protein
MITLVRTSLPIFNLVLNATLDGKEMCMRKVRAQERDGHHKKSQIHMISYKQACLILSKCSFFKFKLIKRNVSPILYSFYN